VCASYSVLYIQYTRTVEKCFCVVYMCMCIYIYLNSGEVCGAGVLDRSLCVC
jgi:hypothetical protein